MKHSTAAAILVYCASHAVAAPIGKRDAQMDLFSGLSGLTSFFPIDLNNINPSDDSPVNPFDDPSNIGKRSAPVLKRTAEAVANIFGDMKKEINKVPGLNMYGQWIPGFNGFRNAVYLGDAITKRDPEPEADPEAEAVLGFDPWEFVPDPTKIDTSDDKWYIPFDDPNNIGKRDASSNDIEKREPNFLEDAIKVYNEAKNMPIVGTAIQEYSPLPFKKRDAEADPEASFTDVLNSVPDMTLLGDFGGIPGLRALETSKRLLKGEFFNGKQEEKRDADPQLGLFQLPSLATSAGKLSWLDNFTTVQQVPKILSAFGLGGSKAT